MTPELQQWIERAIVALGEPPQLVGERELESAGRRYVQRWCNACGKWYWPPEWIKEQHE